MSGERAPLTARSFAFVLVACVTAQVLFSGYSIVLKLFAQDAGADPLVFSALRDVLTTPLLLIAARIFERDRCSMWPQVCYYYYF